ncbi:hypothetical protein ACFQ3W_15030 [Paenibacillus puldeungensis]|uniref:Uncharacterized protein n=1 Tax=Paenibacillus puldeungensis TaxID=696536 RepID=A0ABW3RYL9_9BACL
MKSIQLGGVFVKGNRAGTREAIPPKLTGSARYRGTKRIEQS